MGKITKGVHKINFTMLHGNNCYIFIENFPQKVSPCNLNFFRNFLSKDDINLKKILKNFKKRNSRYIFEIFIFDRFLNQMTIFGETYESEL